MPTTMWHVSRLDDLLPLFHSAGRRNQAIVDCHLAAFADPEEREKQRQRYEIDLPSWAYLFNRDARLLLRTVTIPLEQWYGPAVVYLAIWPHLGEFENSAHLVGSRGFWLSVYPLEMAKLLPKKLFSSGQEMLNFLNWAAIGGDRTFTPARTQEIHQTFVLPLPNNQLRAGLQVWQQQYEPLPDPLSPVIPIQKKPNNSVASAVTPSVAQPKQPVEAAPVQMNSQEWEYTRDDGTILTLQSGGASEHVVLCEFTNQDYFHLEIVLNDQRDARLLTQILRSASKIRQY